MSLSSRFEIYEARGRRGAVVQLFSSPGEACEHMRDHVLTAPESAAWAIVFEAQGISYSALIGGEDLDARQHYCDTLWRDDALARALYMPYSEALRQAIESDHAWQIHDPREGLHACFGLNGALVFIRWHTVATGFLPVSHAARTPHTSHDSPELRREGYATPRSQKKVVSADAERKLFHEVFLPSWQAVRKWSFDRSSQEEPTLHDLAKRRLGQQVEQAARQFKYGITESWWRTRRGV